MSTGDGRDSIIWTTCLLQANLELGISEKVWRQIFGYPRRN